MIKKFLAGFLVLTLLAAALPLGVAFAADDEKYVLEVSRSLVFNDFPTEADTLKASPGITSTDGIKYYAASNYALSYDEASTGVKLVGDGSTVSMSFRIKSNSFAGANMVSLWVDTTGITGDKNGYFWTRPFFDFGAAKSGGKDLGRYMAGGTSFYFVADGSNEVTVLTATKANSAYNVRAPFIANAKGTYYFPETCFQTATVDENGYDYNYPEGSWTSFGDEYLSGTANGWYMNNTNYPYANFTFQQAVIPNGESIIFDDFKWVAAEYKVEGSEEEPETDPDPSAEYAYTFVSQDFSDFTPKFNWSWQWGNYSAYANDPGSALSSDVISIIDGRFAFTPTDTATNGTRYTIHLDEAGAWKSTYEAFSFDLDVSEVTADLTLRPKFIAHDNSDSTDISATFRINNGTIYFIDEDGTVTENTTTSTDSLYQWNIPNGFKGKVLIPAATVHGTGDYSLHGDYAELAFEYEILNWKVADNGATVYVDNLTYYTNVDPESPIPEIEDLGGANIVYTCQDGSVLYTYTDKTADDYAQVCDHFMSKGYETYGAFERNGSLFATYVKDSAMAHVYWFANSGELNFVLSETAGSALPKKTAAPANGSEITVTQLQNATDMNTMTYIIRLADGSFILYDGGFKHLADDILATLKEMTGGKKPVIRAWVLTHSHNDHYQSFNEIACYHCDEITVENVLVAPIDASLAEDNYFNTYLYNDIAKFPEAKTVFVHTGMEFAFSGLNMEILMASDDLYKRNAHNNDMNNSSIVSRLYSDDYSFLLLADMGTEGTGLMADIYGSYLESDMCQMAHHGMETTKADFYEIVKAPIIFCPSNKELYDSSRNKAVRNAVEQMETTKEILIAGNYQFTRAWGTAFNADAELSIPETDVKYTVTVRDHNGNDMATFEIPEGNTISAERMPVASRYGYNFVDWSCDITSPVYSDLVITPIYEKNAQNKHNITVGGEYEIRLPEGQTECYFNDRVVISAPVEKDGKKFAYWKANGSVFSYSASISLLMFGDVHMEAVYENETVAGNVIFTDTNPTITQNGDKYNMHIMGIVSASGEVSEIGILLAAGEYTAEEMVNGTAYTVKMEATSAVNNRQFMYTVKNISSNRIRTAMVYAVVDGVTYYSDATCTAIFE